MNLDRILVFRAGHLGDNLVALPALWALRDAFPNAHISYLSNADLKNPHYVTARGVFPETGLFDSWISYPNLGSRTDILRIAKLALKLRRLNFDAVVYMTTRTRTDRQIARDIRFFRLAGIPRVFGADFMRRHRLDEKLQGSMREIESEGKFIDELLRDSGLINENRFTPDLRITHDEKAAALQWMESAFGSAQPRPLIGVGPGSKWESKIWYEDRFADVIGKLISSHGVTPVIFGGPEDREKGDRLLKIWGRGGNAAGKLNVRQAAAALEECDLYVGNDTGTMHLAAAVGTPCVAIFAAIDLVGRWYPFGERNIVFRRSVECEGCFSPACMNNNKCLDLIETGEVYEACVRILDLRQEPLA
ncbi:MAG TPA: glycosyltransferase family 9 protein [Pyrinomonadaceae bacterium]|nr:glycosyltransferase family 9 protein [Pyrinomonadaceae bacterium]